MRSTMFKYRSNVVFKIMLKWSWHAMLCLSGHVMQFIKANYNTLKISVKNLFHSFQVKESKKYISCNNFIKKDLQLIVKKAMFSTLNTMFKWPCYAIYKIHLQYIKNICGQFISYFSRLRNQKSRSNDSSCFFYYYCSTHSPLSHLEAMC